MHANLYPSLCFFSGGGMAPWHNDEEGDVMVPGALYSEPACKKMERGGRKKRETERKTARRQCNHFYSLILLPDSYPAVPPALAQYLTVPLPPEAET